MPRDIKFHGSHSFFLLTLHGETETSTSVFNICVLITATILITITILIMAVIPILLTSKISFHGSVFHYWMCFNVNSFP